MTQSIEDRLIAANRRPSGFDYLRLILSVLVVLTHSVQVVYGLPYAQITFSGEFRPLYAAILPMFFALSGFLVAGSLERCRTLVSFIGLRVIRLAPALLVETTLSALVIGTLFTTFPLGEYFRAPEFRAYFLNVIGDIHYILPGLFQDNPRPSSVNGQLWTLPFELLCYMSVAMAGVLRIIQNRRSFFIFVLILNFVLLFHEAMKTQVIINQPVMIGVALVQCFLYGICLYLYRRTIAWNPWMFLAAVALTYVLLTPAHRWWGDYVAPLPLTYITVYLGLLRPRRSQLALSGDYSYGIFLYGYPIQQAVIASTGTYGHNWAVNFLISMPVILATAAFSWWCVEKPSLRLRAKLTGVEEFVVRSMARLPGGSIILPPLTAPQD